MSSYTVLNRQIYFNNGYSIVPIRAQDRYDIMHWRNEQIYHLRQKGFLTPKNQDDYFKNEISNLFQMEQPDQILFSYLKGEQCIGYGGLVHINWQDLNAEISFIMNTKLENIFFEHYWKNYLEMIEEVAFTQLKLHKIFTYAFNLRPNLYPIFLSMGFNQDAILREHIKIGNGYIDVVIHSKINKS